MDAEDFECYGYDVYYNRGYWETKDHKTLKIELMESSHIKNCINLLKRNLQKLDGEEKDLYEGYILYKINEFEKELKKRDVYKRHISGDETPAIL